MSQINPEQMGLDDHSFNVHEWWFEKSGLQSGNCKYMSRSFEYLTIDGQLYTIVEMLIYLANRRWTLAFLRETTQLWTVPTVDRPFLAVSTPVAETTCQFEKACRDMQKYIL